MSRLGLRIAQKKVDRIGPAMPRSKAKRIWKTKWIDRSSKTHSRKERSIRRMENSSEAMFWQAKEIKGNWYSKIISVLILLPILTSTIVILSLHSYFRRNHAVFFSKEIYSFVHRESLHKIVTIGHISVNSDKTCPT